MLKLLNSKGKGDYAVSLAIVYFIGNGYQALLPSGDRGHYDLVVERDGIFQRVQSKWTSSTKPGYGYPVVSLCVSGSHKVEGGVAKTVCHIYQKTDFDLLWVVTPYTCYLIPFSKILNGRISKSDIKLYPKWDKYRVAIPIPKKDESDESFNRLSPRLTKEDKMTMKRLLKEKKSSKEIADILNVSTSCIRVQLSRNREFYFS
jgi:hypothetical protein